MAAFFTRSVPVHKGVSIVDNEAYKDYKKWSKLRDPKKIRYYKDYKKMARLIWNRVADYSIEYESGVYDSKFFYLIPQVVDNRPFIETSGGSIETNSHTGGNIYTPLFCNLFKKYNQFCWSVDGSFVNSYKKKLKNKIDKLAPRYYFILKTLKKNKL